MDKDKDLSAETLLAHGGEAPEPTTGAVVPPLHFSTTFARNAQYELMGEYIYGRYQNPTFDPVEKLAATLDKGAEAKLFASGMAGITAIFETVNAGEHIVAPTVMYHGAQDWLRYISRKRNIDLTLFDASDPEGLEKALRPGKTVIVWIESPVNPTWDVIDIAASAQAAHSAGAILAVDATVSTPITTQPISLGADLVFHSATKYLNGHSDVTAGIVVTREKNERWEEIKMIRKYVGGIQGPFEAWLLLRGMRTLSLRFERASENALKLARHFENHPKIEKVLYPGLESHPGHHIAKKQMSNGFGGMMSLLVNGDAAYAQQVATRAKVFTPATSLGGVESLIEHRASVEGPHSVVPKNLIRLSVGIEEVQDLINDLEQALS